MKLTRMLSIGAVCVATSAFPGGSWASASAEDSAVSVDASLASQAALDAVETAVDAKDLAFCLEKGFDAETLDCRVCNMLALTLSLQQEENATADAALAEAKQRATEGAVGTCQRCCTDVEAIDALAHAQQYARVVLEVCTCKFGRLPKIANFVNHHAAQHARLEVKYINARMPHLLFYDDNGEKKEEISIASWDEETISEFIEAKLKKQEPEPEAEVEPAAEQQEDAAEEPASEETDVEAEEETESEESDDVVEVEVAVESQ